MTKRKVGIIGCGRIFAMHALPIENRSDLELIAVCDIKADRAEAAAKEHNCASYTDYTEMFEQEELDVIHICLPHHLHHPVTLDAAKRKIHVLTEKPMAIHYDDAVEMVDVAKENDVTLGVIFQTRYNPASQLIKHTIASGELGAVKAARFSLAWDRSDEYYSESDWKGTWEKEGGGVIIDQAIHGMDLMSWFVDGEIEYIDASISNRAHAKIEVEDAAEGVIKYTNGVVTAFHAINYYSHDAPIEIEIDCEKGLVQMVADKATIAFHDGRTLIADNNPLEEFEYSSGAKNYWGISHIKQINNFYDSLNKGVQPDITGETALKTQKMINKIYESGKKKERVFL